MSKGGAGKVYFVLYLAVILELLIIIVERDEAEEHLMQRQKESMRIVESILSQLQTGTGTEGISTRPRDEITLQDAAMASLGGPKIPQDRKYFVEVGVTDVFNDAKINKEEEGSDEKLKTLIQLSNVQELAYQIWYCRSDNDQGAPDFPDSAVTLTKLEDLKDGSTFTGRDNSQWSLRFQRKIELNLPETYKVGDYRKPIYKDYNEKYSIGSFGNFAPPEALGKDSAFRYTQPQTEILALQEREHIKKRAFVVHFKAPSEPGWYKLRFYSRTNRILGVTGENIKFDELSDDMKVNIGTVQLKIKDLRTVKEQLTRQLEGVRVPSADELGQGKIKAEKFDEEIAAALNDVGNTKTGEEKTKMLGRITLYQYLAKLLAPNSGDLFAQNKSSYQVDVRVVKPEVNIAEPYVTFSDLEFFTFETVKPAFSFTSGPYQGNNPPTANIITPQGPKPVTIVPVDGVADASGGAGKGGKRFYKAYLPQTLTPGKYTIEVVQSNSGKQKREEAKLEVFQTSLTKKSKELLDGKMRGLYYGQVAKVTVEPSSGTKIPSAQFKVAFRLDNDQQNSGTTGFTAECPLRANGDKAMIRVSWQNPYIDGKEGEVVLYENSGAIQQEEPGVQLNTATSKPSLSGKKLKVEYKDIRVLLPAIDVGGKEAEVKDIDKPEIAGVKPNIPGFEISDYRLESVGDGTFTAIFELTGAIPKGEKEASGTIEAQVKFRVKNSINKKTSSEATESLLINVTADDANKKKKK